MSVSTRCVPFDGRGCSRPRTWRSKQGVMYANEESPIKEHDMVKVKAKAKANGKSKATKRGKLKRVQETPQDVPAEVKPVAPPDEVATDFTEEYLAYKEKVAAEAEEDRRQDIARARKAAEGDPALSAAHELADRLLSTDASASAQTEPLPPDLEYQIMTEKAKKIALKQKRLADLKARKAAEPKQPKTKREPKAPQEPKAKRQPKASSNGKAREAGGLSQIEAAAQVLAKAGKPMNCREMVEVMATSGLWTSPGGKTPHATLYSAILREITTKGKDARFKKSDRGHFVHA